MGELLHPYTLYTPYTGNANSLITVLIRMAKFKKGKKVRHLDGRQGVYYGKSSVEGKCYVDFGSKMCDGEPIIDLVYEKDLEEVE